MTAESSDQTHHGLSTMIWIIHNGRWNHVQIISLPCELLCSEVTNDWVDDRSKILLLDLTGYTAFNGVSANPACLRERYSLLEKPAGIHVLRSRTEDRLVVQRLYIVICVMI